MHTVSNKKRKRPRSEKPERLDEWFKRWVEVFRSAYRSAVEAGYPADIVVRATPPRTERVEDPPAGFHFQTLAQARATIDRDLPAVRGGLDRPLLPGTFWAIASRPGERGITAIVLAMVKIPIDEELPPLILEGPGRLWPSNN
jgi:hypothetical protein